jgi:hypothetical protein
MFKRQAQFTDALWLAAQDFDPFDIPMPVVAPGVAPEDAFAELDTDNNGVIKGEEFAAIPKSDKFNKVTREEMVRRRVRRLDACERRREYETACVCGLHGCGCCCVCGARDYLV